MHEEIREIIGSKYCISSGCIRVKDGCISMEKEDILESWAEYTEEQFEDDRGERPTIN